MKHFSAHPKELILGPWCHRGLLKNLIVREIAGRYRGSMLGLLWSIFNPLFMLAVYTFVFGYVFNATWVGGSGAKTEFALVLFAGLLMFNFFAECFTRAPTVILSNANYVKKVIFPLELLPWVLLGSALFHLVVSLGVWFVAHFVLVGLPKAHVLLFPIILFPFVLFTLGVSCFFASLGVYLRDVAHINGILTNVLLFMSAVFFPVDSLPESVHRLIFLNPLVPPIEMSRQVLYMGQQPDWRLYIAYFTGSVIVAMLGFAWFQKTRRGFSDVL